MYTLLENKGWSYQNHFTLCLKACLLSNFEVKLFHIPYIWLFSSVGGTHVMLHPLFGHVFTALTCNTPKLEEFWQQSFVVLFQNKQFLPASMKQVIVNKRWRLQGDVYIT